MKKLVVWAAITILAATCWGDVVPVSLTGRWRAEYGDSGKELQCDSTTGWVDLASAWPEAVGAKLPATVETRFVSAQGGEALFGFGGDWWAQVSLNGELLLDTDARGNGTSPITAGNHLFLGRVKAGENLISVRIRPGADGFGFVLAPMAPTAENFRLALPQEEFKKRFPEYSEILCGPYLSHPAPGEVTVNFVTTRPMAGFVEYREAAAGDDAPWQKAGQLLGGQYRCDRDYFNVRLKGLVPGREYVYRLSFLEPYPLRRISDDRVFRFTAPGAEPTEHTAFIISDTQFNPARLKNLIRQFYALDAMQNADMFVHLGDVYDNFDHAKDSFFTNFMSLLPREYWADKIMVQVRGNHELRGVECNQFFRYFATPDGKSYYAFRRGEVFYIVLDAVEDKPADPAKAPYTAFNDAAAYMAGQAEWLKALTRDEAFRTAKFRVVLCHGFPENDMYMEKYLYDMVSGIFIGENAPYRLHLWICGHTHNFCRSMPGADQGRMFEIRARQPRFRDLPFTVVINDGPHDGGVDASALLLKVDDEFLTVQAMTPDGEIFDSFEVDCEGKVRETGSQLQWLKAK